MRIWVSGEFNLMGFVVVVRYQERWVPSAPSSQRGSSSLKVVRNQKIPTTCTRVTRSIEKVDDLSIPDHMSVAFSWLQRSCSEWESLQDVASDWPCFWRIESEGELLKWGCRAKASLVMAFHLLLWMLAFYKTGGRTQGLTHARQVFHHRALPPAREWRVVKGD